MKKLFYLTICIAMMGISQSFAQTACNAQYTSAPFPGTSSNALRVVFDNTSTGSSGPASYYTLSKIFFGDGASGFIGTELFHNYTTTGTYSTMLVVQTIDSLTSNVVCSDTAYHQITVNYSPCAFAISAQANGGGSTTFTVSNLSGGALPSNSNWDFGDGTTGTGIPITHTYATTGIYYVTFYGNNSACANTDSMYYHNNDTSNVDCNALAIGFTSSVTGLNVTFQNTSSIASPGVIANQADWYFGDGTSQTGNYGGANHTYPGAGTYSVTMINRWVDSLSGQLYCVDSITQPVTVDSSTFPNIISGSITWDSIAPLANADSFKIWLITYDSSANTLTAIDSTYGYSSATFYTFNNPASGDYLVKAALLNQTPGTQGLVPTYYQSSVYWGTATTIHHIGGYNTGRNIQMQNGSVTSGPGFVGGNISSGAGRGTGTGAPGIIVYLRGDNNVLVASSITDINGDYSFSNIPLGTYNVYPELMNYATTPYNTISVTTAQANVAAIDFEKVGNTIVPKNKPTSIAAIGKEDGLNVYPNPAKNQLVIESKNGLFNKVVIVNTLGQTIQESKLVNGVNKIQLSGINAGIYFLQISGADQTRSMKIIKE